MKRSQSTGERGSAAPFARVPGATGQSRARTLSARGVLLLMLCGVMALALPIARGQERNFAGSVQGSYLYVHDGKNERARERSLDGFVTEMSVKVAVDFSDHISTNVKVCFGCHGFELGMAYVDLTVSDALRFRVGRFSPSFGEFQLRHDPANTARQQALPTKLVACALREWNRLSPPSSKRRRGRRHALFGRCSRRLRGHAVGRPVGRQRRADSTSSQRGGLLTRQQFATRLGGRLSANIDLATTTSRTPSDTLLRDGTTPSRSVFVSRGRTEGHQSVECGQSIAAPTE